jgi:ABC-type sugar transport system ATPase subunit
LIAIKVRNISKSFGAVVALRNASLSVERGEVRAILGGNGSGKSTLAKIIGGAVKPNDGVVELFGSEQAIHDPRSAKRVGVVITSQELSVFNNLSVIENILLCDLPVRGGLFVDRKAVRKKAVATLARMNIEHLADVKFEHLSLSQQYLVEFAKAVVQQPKILICDEITSAMYREQVEVVKDIIRGLADAGCAVLFITHRMSEIYSICDSASVMKNGETVGTFALGRIGHFELLSLMTGQSVEEIRESSAQQRESVGSAGRSPVIAVKDLPIEKFATRVSLEAHAGEIIGIAGLQGHGQSDMIRTLFGLNDSVEIEMMGESKRISSPRDAVRNRIAFVSGDREGEGVFTGRSVSENLLVVRNSLNQHDAFNETALLRKYGVVFSHARQLINTLSGGNQQKVVVGRWTATAPFLFLADDPTKGIDIQARKDFRGILRELAAAGSAVIIVSSDDEELVELSKVTDDSRILVMYEGNFVASLSGADITLDNIVAAAIPKGI